MRLYNELVLLVSKITVDPKDINVPNSTANVGVAATNTVKFLIEVIGSLAILALIAGGIQLAVSAGNAKRVQQGRETIIYAVVGLLIAISAAAVVWFIESATG